MVVETIFAKSGDSEAIYSEVSALEPVTDVELNNMLDDADRLRETAGINFFARIRAEVIAQRAMRAYLGRLRDAFHTHF